MEGIHPAIGSYERVAQAYEHGRPDYPPAAIDHLLTAERPIATVVDLAAGTGKLTRHLVGRVARIVAIEPVRAFRAMLASAMPSVEVVAGLAAAIPLLDGVADGVIIGQAFHWFANPAALAEIRRVLADGGALAMVWNVRASSSAAQQEASTLLEAYRSAAPSYGTGEWAHVFEDAPFRPLELTRFEWEHTVDRQMFVDRFGSVSVIAALDDVARGVMLQRFGEVFDRHATHGALCLPYTTEVWVTAPIT